MIPALKSYILGLELVFRSWPFSCILSGHHINQLLDVVKFSEAHVQVAGDRLSPQSLADVVMLDD